MRLGPTILISFRDEQLKHQLASITYDAADKTARFVASANRHLTPVETIDMIVPPYTRDETSRTSEAGLEKI